MNFLGRLALQEKKNLMTARVSMLLKSRASPDMSPFSLRNKKRLAIPDMNSLLFPTTLSIPSYDIGKYVGRRTFQHPLIFLRVQFSKHRMLSNDVGICYSNTQRDITTGKYKIRGLFELCTSTLRVASYQFTSICKTAF